MEQPSYQPTNPESPEASKNKKILIIVVVVVLVLCCCCTSLGLLAWNYGDQALESFGMLY